MKTESEIRMDFQQAIEQARRLDALADSMDRRTAGRMGSAIEGVHSAWRGDSAARYLGKVQTLQKEVRQSANSLRAAASEVRRIARQIYEAEMRALEVAQSRRS